MKGILDFINTGSAASSGEIKYKSVPIEEVAHIDEMIRNHRLSQPIIMHRKDHDRLKMIWEKGILFERPPSVKNIVAQ